MCIWEDIEQFMLRAVKSAHPFMAAQEIWHHRSDRIVSHHVYLRPCPHLVHLMAEVAASGNFVPRTNGEQDVLESVFDPVNAVLRLKSVGGWPQYIHSKPLDRLRASLHAIDGTESVRRRHKISSSPSNVKAAKEEQRKTQIR